MKKILTCLLMILTVTTIVISVFADVVGDTDVDFPSTGASSSNSSHDVVNRTVGNIWKTLTTVVQVLALGTVVFAGLRYMFASADKKADIKRGLGYLAIGAMFVFAASTIASFIVNVGQDII